MHLFVRTSSDVDGIVSPLTYLGTGKFQNIRESSVGNKVALIMDIVLDEPIDPIYYFDYGINV